MHKRIWLARFTLTVGFMSVRHWAAASALAAAHDRARSFTAFEITSFAGASA